MHRDIQLGARLKAQREALGWSQQQAADTAGVRREMWARYESGAEPGAAALAQLAAAGIDVLYILTGQRGAPNASAPTHLPSPLTPREAALLDNYRHAPEEGRVAIDKTSAALAQSHALTPQTRTRKHKAQGG